MSEIDWAEAVFEVGRYQSNSSSSSLKMFVDRVDKDFDHLENAVYSVTMTNGCCMYCGTDLYYVDDDGTTRVHAGTWDHLIPASRFGLRTLGNLPLVCADCNNAKDHMLASEYWTERRLHDQPLWVDDQDKFMVFLREFCAPYRENFPRFFEAALHYKPLESDDNTLIMELFLLPDPDTGKPAIDFNDRWNHRRLQTTQEDLVASVLKEIDSIYEDNDVLLVETLHHIINRWDSQYDYEISVAPVEVFAEFVHGTLLSHAIANRREYYTKIATVFRLIGNADGRRPIRNVANNILAFKRFCRAEGIDHWS